VTPIQMSDAENSPMTSRRQLNSASRTRKDSATAESYLILIC
jgi:hypothetical protein